MMEEFTYLNRQSLRLLLIGTVLFVIYYLADCALDAHLFGEGTFSENLLSPSPHEVAIRSLSGFFLFSLYLVASILLNRNRALQHAILEKSQQLQDKNRALEAYNQSLSTDLRGSLTALKLAVERLKFTTITGDATRTPDLLRQLKHDCKVLSGQFDELIGLAAINRVELERKRVALDGIVRAITSDLAAKRGQRIDVRVDAMPETDCDPELMQIALKNLISSLDAAQANRTEAIRVGVKRRGGLPIYFIRAVCKRNTAPAQRSDAARRQVEVTTARSIIERHGGQLWAKGPGDALQGFYFSL